MSVTLRCVLCIFGGAEIIVFNLIASIGLWSHSVMKIPLELVVKSFACVNKGKEF